MSSLPSAALQTNRVAFDYAMNGRVEKPKFQPLLAQKTQQRYSNIHPFIGESKSSEVDNLIRNLKQRASAKNNTITATNLAQSKFDFRPGTTTTSQQLPQANQKQKVGDALQVKSVNQNQVLHSYSDPRIRLSHKYYSRIQRGSVVLGAENARSRNTMACTSIGIFEQRNSTKPATPLDHLKHPKSFLSSSQQIDLSGMVTRMDNEIPNRQSFSTRSVKLSQKQTLR